MHIQVYIDLIYVFTKLICPWVGCDTRSIFKRSRVGLNLEFSFFLTSWLTKIKKHRLSDYLLIFGVRRDRFMPFLMTLVRSETQKAFAEFELSSYCLGFSDYFLHFYCYFYNVSADMSSGLFQVFVELGNLHRTSNYVFYWIHGGRLFWFRLP